jgi:acyl-CoA synthetase (AMP-forming)/AMP-acid ligase II
MSAWNFADVWETVAEAEPAAGALTHGETTITWSDLDHRADNLARHLLESGVVHQDKVSLYLYNCPEYLEATFACLKIGLVPINTNYRYADDELIYLWENADTVAVVFHGAFTDRIESIHHRVAGVRLWLWVDDGSGACPHWAVDYASLAVSDVPGEPGRTRAPWDRGPDDLYMLYTGGTTGMPKGVMWRQDDLFVRLNGAGFRHYPIDGGPEDVRAEIQQSGPGMTLLPACPLMHGTGGFTALELLSEGGARGHPSVPTVRPGRASGHGRAAVGQRPDHRGGRLRQTHLGQARRRPRSLGPLQPGRHPLVGGDVERGDQGRAPRAPSRHAPHRRLLVVRGHRHWQLGVIGRLRSRHRHLHPRARGPSHRRRRT